MNEAYITIAIAIVAQTVALGYYAGTLHSTLKYLKKIVEDHENRIRDLEA